MDRQRDRRATHNAVREPDGVLPHDAELLFNPAVHGLPELALGHGGGALAAERHACAGREKARLQGD